MKHEDAQAGRLAGKANKILLGGIPKMYGRRPYGFGFGGFGRRPFGFGGPFLGGFVGGLAAGALLRPPGFGFFPVYRPFYPPFFYY